MDAPQFRAVARSLLADSSFADFKIKCGEKEYKVHRFILACQSKYFKSCFDGKYKESESSTIEIKDEDAEPLDLMINYFYCFDYDDTPKADSRAGNAMQLNAAIYAMADTYDADDLKALAIRKFGIAAAAVLSANQDLLDAIGDVYCSTPGSDRGLRDVCASIWVLAADRIIAAQGRRKVEDFLLKTPQFGADIAFRSLTYAVAGKFKITGDCSCHKVNGLHPNEAVGHTWVGAAGETRPDLYVQKTVTYKVPQFWVEK